MENSYQILVSLITVVIVMAASWFAYDQGYMDPLIEKFGYVSCGGPFFSGLVGWLIGGGNSGGGRLHISIEIWFSLKRQNILITDDFLIFPETVST